MEAILLSGMIKEVMANQKVKEGIWTINNLL